MYVLNVEMVKWWGIVYPRKNAHQDEEPDRQVETYRSLRAAVAAFRRIKSSLMEVFPVTRIGPRVTWHPLPLDERTITWIAWSFDGDPLFTRGGGTKLTIVLARRAVNTPPRTLIKSIKRMRAYGKALQSCIDFSRALPGAPS